MHAVRCGLRTGEDPPHPGDRPLQIVQRHCGWNGHNWRGGSFQEVRSTQGELMTVFSKLLVFCRQPTEYF